MTRSEAEAAGRLWLGGGVPFAVVRSDRARRVRLRVRADGVLLTVPRGAAYEEALQLMRGHRDWAIERWVAHLARAARTAEDAEALRGTVWLRGDALRIERVLADRVRVAARTDALRVWAPDPEKAERGLLAWLRVEAERDLVASVAAWAPQIGTAPVRVSVRDQRTKWGAATARGSVTFNWRLVMAPPAVLEYVVVHELAHLVEMNHSPRFWAIVARHVPEWRARREWLRRHQAALSAMPRLQDGQTAAASASLRA